MQKSSRLGLPFMTPLKVLVCTYIYIYRIQQDVTSCNIMQHHVTIPVPWMVRGRLLMNQDILGHGERPDPGLHRGVSSFSSWSGLDRLVASTEVRCAASPARCTLYGENGPTHGPEPDPRAPVVPPQMV